MKAEFDKEIDTLLRRNARAAGRGARGGGEGADGASAHLDADELSAFAENALPAAARLSAVSHLADCDECRGSAVILSRAAGAATELEKRAAVPASAAAGDAASRRGWLASLFTPRVLRFVAPALALCIVGAVALVVLRTRRDAGTVAQLKEESPDARPNILTEAGANLNAGANVNATADITTRAEQANTTSAPDAADAPAPAADARTQEPSGAPAGGIVAPQPAEDEAKAEGEAPARPAPAAQAPPESVSTVAAPAAPPPPPPAEAREAAKRKKEDQERGEEVARSENTPQEKRAEQYGNLDNQQTPDGARNKSASPSYRGGRAAPRPEPERTNRSLGGPRARRGANEEARRDADDDAPAGETRAVAGRRFRREGGAWVDVNYRSSMSMTGVRRGTEAYRALVADIPELSRIAEQLGGEVITVVRGRAYRIR